MTTKKINLASAFVSFRYILVDDLINDLLLYLLTKRNSLFNGI